MIPIGIEKCLSLSSCQLKWLGLVLNFHFLRFGKFKPASQENEEKLPVGGEEHWL